MKFSEMPYKRPDFDALYNQMKALLEDMEKAPTAEDFFKAMEALDKVGRNLGTQQTLAYIRNTINTKDPFYSAEKDVMDEALPRFAEISTQAARITLESPHKAAVAKKYGEHLLEKYKVKLDTFRPEILDDLVEENKLKSEYQRLMASAEIEFEGETRNLSGMIPFMESKDRDMRRRASAAS